MGISNDELVSKIREFAEKGKVLADPEVFNQALDTRPDLTGQLNHIQTSLFIGEITQLDMKNKPAARDYLYARQYVYRMIIGKFGRQQTL